MKIIKSFLLITVCVSATNLLCAQEVKTEVLKKTEIKAPAPPAEVNKPSPAPVFKPQDGVAANETPVKASETPSPFKKDENKKQVEEPKTQLLAIDANAATNKLTPEQLKTLNGTAEKPKQPAAAPNTVDQNARPVPITNIAVLKPEQKQ